MTLPRNLFEQAAAIRLVVMDVDGVLTDGRITYTAAGDEIKAFNVKDGLGLSLAVRAGLQLGIITARESDMVRRRADELGIQHVVQKMKTKLPALEKLAAELGLSLAEVAYIGDDLPDVPCMQAVGLAACPADAAREAQESAALVARANGGQGAVREILEFIIESRALLSPASSEN